MTALIVVLIFSACIGFFAQVTGLCMVRGVSDWLQRRPIRLLAILGTGFWAYVFFPLMDSARIPMHLQRYEMHWGFLLGGFIFGIGAAVNGACSISTVGRLSSGDTRMVMTILGWPVGWLLLEYSGTRFDYSRLAEMNDWLPRLSWLMLVFLALASIRVYFKHRRLWRIWGGIMLVGILAGAVLLLQPTWSPSEFVKDLGTATVARDSGQLLSVERIAILAMMLIGMGIVAWKYHRFQLVFPGARPVGKHLFAGVLMGITAGRYTWMTTRITTAQCNLFVPAGNLPLHVGSARGEYAACNPDTARDAETRATPRRSQESCHVTSNAITTTIVGTPSRAT